jgi:long-chain acyl-CoA synthetase
VQLGRATPRILDPQDSEEGAHLAAAPDLGSNLLELFERTAIRRASAPCLWAKRDGTYRPWSWQRVASEVRLLAHALRIKGIVPGDRVLLVAENRPEWAIADLAIMAAGAVTVPAYTTNTAENHAYLLNHSEAAAVVVSTERLAARLRPALTPALKLVISMEPLNAADQLSVPVLAWLEALALGEQTATASPAPAAKLSRDDLACFIYTSGTGGNPKGVMLTHGNILANVAGALGVLETLGLRDEEVFLSFLPLSHAYEHTAGQFLPMAVGAQIYYADGLETLASDFLEVRPTIVACVPRLYEVMRQRILRMTARQPAFKAKLFAKAVALGSKAYERPESMNLAERMLNRLLDKLVRDAVRARFGGRIKALVSGGAPLNYDVGLFFTALGVPLFQGYGLTECAPVISVNRPGNTKLHTVGRPIPGMDVRIVEDGEILVHGRSVMRGYWRDEAATSQVLRDGWLHTGDVGVIDEDGFLQITDRKKDIIVNSGGDNVAPQRVEGVMALQPEIAQVIVYGDGRPHLVALIVPDAEFAKTYARQHELTPDLAELVQHKDFERAIGDAVARANQGLSVIERVRHFRLLAEPFSIEKGTMTPTLKLKRQLIYRTHRDLFESLYQAQHQYA